MLAYCLLLFITTLQIYNVYIRKAMDFYGVTKTRPIFESAIERLPEDRSREMSLHYAQMERNLGEVDRARAIYAHCSEICDPRVSSYLMINAS